MNSILIRPHHSLCMQFFQGSGYSENFISATAALLMTLNGENPLVTLTNGCDSFAALARIMSRVSAAIRRRFSGSMMPAFLLLGSHTEKPSAGSSFLKLPPAPS